MPGPVRVAICDYDDFTRRRHGFSQTRQAAAEVRVCSLGRYDNRDGQLRSGRHCADTNWRTSGQLLLGSPRVGSSQEVQSRKETQETPSWSLRSIGFGIGWWHRQASWGNLPTGTASQGRHSDPCKGTGRSRRFSQVGPSHNSRTIDKIFWHPSESVHEKLGARSSPCIVSGLGAATVSGTVISHPEPWRQSLFVSAPMVCLPFEATRPEGEISRSPRLTIRHGRLEPIGK